MTSSPHGLYVQGYTRATMAGTKRPEAAKRRQSQKTGLSSDCRLQLACSRKTQHHSEPRPEGSAHGPAGPPKVMKTPRLAGERALPTMAGQGFRFCGAGARLL